MDLIISLFTKGAGELSGFEPEAVLLVLDRRGINIFCFALRIADDYFQIGYLRLQAVHLHQNRKFIADTASDLSKDLP